MTENNEKVNHGYTVSNSRPEWAQSIYMVLERPNWAPWLAASADTLGRRAEVFPEGQLVIMRNDEVLMASLSMNRINWDGNPDALPSWDDVAMETFHSDPYSSWQRGTNENANGLIRCYFPKGTDFARVSDEDLEDVIWELNNRPRKLLQYKTAQEVFDEHLNLP